MTDHQLPFAVSSRSWSELSEEERDFFCFEDEYLPLHPNHAAQIALLIPDDARRLTSWLFSAVPEAWSEWNRTSRRFKSKDSLSIRESWNTAGVAKVRRWLFNCGIPLQRVVYLIYEPNRVVQTTWRMLVRYWDAFAWSVGIAMVAVDHTLQWACVFHHEDVIRFASHRKTC
jgi:hypothetical protein